MLTFLEKNMNLIKPKQFSESKFFDMNLLKSFYSQLTRYSQVVNIVDNYKKGYIFMLKNQ